MLKPSYKDTRTTLTTFILLTLNIFDTFSHIFLFINFDLKHSSAYMTNDR